MPEGQVQAKCYLSRIYVHTDAGRERITSLLLGSGEMWIDVWRLAGTRKFSA